MCQALFSADDTVVNKIDENLHSDTAYLPRGEEHRETKKKKKKRDGVEREK